MFRLAHVPGSSEEAAFLDLAQATLTGVPGATDFVVNKQVSAKSDLAWQFSMVFADQAAYDGYNTHPDHVGFVQDRWVPEVVAFQEFDFILR